MTMESNNRSSANMYRVGDYVFFESSTTSPYHIRRIEELNKTTNGNVEAKVMCFFRRRDLSSSLTFLADRHQSALEEEEGKDKENLTPKQRHLIHHRELFLSRQVETLPATQIRGKCSVTLLNETECLESYLKKDDTFYYSLVYDPQQKTLLADRGEIRVGQRYQADSIPKLKTDGSSRMLKKGEEDDRRFEDLEELVWTPEHGLTDKQIDQFLVISRSVGTFARALDCSSSVKQPSLHMSAAAASRDVTLFHSMDLLHSHSYNISGAVSALVPSSGPVLCRDEMEEWSASEANLFEEALEKYGKDFADIRSDFLPWKTLKNIIEYYYMWKTTDRYVQQKRVKAAEAETKLKQVYIPNYKSNSSSISGKIMNGNNTPEPLIPGKPCEACSSTMSTQWYAWTGNSGMQARLCSNCWNYWRKYGGLKTPNKLNDLCKSDLVDGEIEMIKKHKDELEPQVDRAPGLMQPRLHRCGVNNCGKDFKMKNQLARHYATAHGFSMRSGSPRPTVLKSRTGIQQAFYLHTTTTTRIARRVCVDILRTRHATRSPFWPTNGNLIKQEYIQRTIGKEGSELIALIKGRKRKLPDAKVSEVAHKLGQPERTVADWLILTEKSKMPKPDFVAFPKPPKGPDGSLIYERVPEKHIIAVNNISPNSLLKRGYEGFNGVDSAAAKKMNWEANQNKTSSREGSPSLPSTQHLPPSTGFSPNARSLLTHMNGTKAKIATMTRIGSRKQIISWSDAPDDLYFCSNDNSKKLRKSLTPNEMRRLARTPTKGVLRKSLVDAYNYTPAVPVRPASAEQQQH